jgi:dihydrolipoamide dehydrogenase
MMEKSYDVAIIGSGPGGYVAAIRAAQLKLKTVLIERENLGGICLNWGCIPTKALLKNAEVYSLFKNAKDFGFSVDNLSFDFSKVIQRSRKVADTNSKGVDFLMKKNKIDVVMGDAKLNAPSKIAITTQDGNQSEINAKHIIIATGGRPRTLPNVKFDGEFIIEYRKAMSLTKQPDSMIIIGAGAIGVEFAYFYNEMGTKVTIVEMLDQILPIEDKEIADILTRSFKRKKIDIHTSTRVESVKKKGKGVEVEISAKDKKVTIRADVALIAIGIQGNVEDLGLKEAGVKFDQGFIAVNEWYETNVKGIYAIGDITGPPLLAHVASHEGIVCIEKIASIDTHPVDYGSIPGCTYCNPQVASIGMTEARAKEAGYDVQIGRFPYAASGKARAIGERDGLVKLIFDKKYGELLGAHIIGAEATELIAELGMAKSLESTPVEISKTMHAHPTLSEMIMEAAADAQGEAIHI